jgi:hypothetical protein
MGVIAFVGCYDDESLAPISGTGKTLSMTGFGYLDSLEGTEIWSNYDTSFSDEVLGFQKMIDKIKLERSNLLRKNTDERIKDFTNINKDDDTRNLVLLITEMQEVLNSCGSKNSQVLFIDSFAHQLRKYEVDLYYDTQRFMNIHKRLRTHTDKILLPFKRHMNKKPCLSSRCKLPHLIDVYSIKPNLDFPIQRFNAAKVGALYNSHQVIIDKLKIPTEKEIQKEQDEE